MQATQSGQAASEDALAFARSERARCLSDREWRHRLRGYGYDVRQTADGPVLTLLATGVALGPIDPA
jgi:hypothetical protein